MLTLAIKGHPTRGKEVIEILEMLGGKNHYFCFGNGDDKYYAILGIDKEIHIVNPNCNSFYKLTLEEFIEKFPYKVWDKVQHNGATSCGTVYVIERMNWANNHIEYEIRQLHDYNHTGLVTVCAEDLQPFKEQAMIDKLEQITLDIPDGYEFFGINDDNKVVLTKKQPQYPKTYEECCEILKVTHCEWSGYLGEVLVPFQKLLICRNAYWKIAREQMGLGKPWKPCWTIYKHKFCLGTDKDKVIEECVTTGNRILAFPTEEMRDAFYENFKDLIEYVKELL